MNMVQSRFNSPFELEMQQTFIAEAKRISLSLDDFVAKPGVYKVGMESEYSLLTSSYSQADQSVRDSIIAQDPSIFDKELGAAQIELWTGPVNLLGKELNLLIDDYRLKESLLGRLADQSGSRVLRSGSNPFVPLSEVAVTKGCFKYELSMDFHRRNRRHPLDTTFGLEEIVDVADPSCISLFNAVHFNIDCLHIKDAIDKLNRSLMLSPLLTAFGTNAMFLDYKMTGIADIRLPAWQISHDVRTTREVGDGLLTRIGMPKAYYKDVYDYFDQLLAHPFIIGQDPVVREHAFDVAIGLNWRDARLKFLRDGKNILIVEFRALPMQPTLEDDAAMLMFYLGRLLWSQQNHEELLPFDIVVDDKIQAMNYGLFARLHCRDKNGNLKTEVAHKLLDLEIERASIGLLKFGLDPKEFDFPGFISRKIYNQCRSNAIELFLKTISVDNSIGSRKDVLIQIFKNACI